MASARHKHTLERSPVRRVLRVSVPTFAVLALVAGSMVVAFGGSSSAPATASTSGSVNLNDFANRVSRSQPRLPLVTVPTVAAPKEKAPKVTAKKFVVVALDIRTKPVEDAKVRGEAKAGSKVGVTGKTKDGFSEIAFEDAAGWVKTKWLSDDEPTGGAPCASGSAMESGLQPDTIRVHRAVCAVFPQISRYLGRGGGGEHASGRAVDIMTTDRATGDAIAAYAQAHSRELGVSQVIWQQRIWTVQRAGDGWRSMPNRGSATANHMNHVHVSTYGNRGTTTVG